MKALVLLAAALAVPALVAAQEPPATPDNIFDAIHAGDPVRVKKLLDANPKRVAHKNGSGVTPLHVAAERYNPEVVKVLLDAGANVNETFGDSEYTPLHGAVRLGGKEVVALLLARGADVNAGTKSDLFTPLHAAADRGHMAILALLLAKGASPDGGWKKDSGKYPVYTPLSYAVRERHLDAIRLLIAKGATIDAPSCFRNDTLLFGAVERDDVEVVKLLLQKGADPNNSGALLRALSMGRPEMIRLFVENGADFETDPQLLVYAAASGKTEVVELALVKSGIVLTDAENRGMPALFYASQNGPTDVVRFLLGKGVDPNILGKHHTLPLHIAATKEIAELLLKHKAKVDEPDAQGVTPMHAAVLRGNRAVAELLDARGAKHTPETLAALGHADELKERLKKEPLKKERPKGPVRPTLLHLATSFGRFTTARVLIDAGADVSAADPEGKTPLHRAADVGELATVRALIAAGVDVSALDRLDGTPLHTAAARGHLAVVELLIEHKADVNAKMKGQTYGRSPPGSITPMMVALGGGHADVVRVLAKVGGLPAIDGARNATALLPAAAKNKHWALVRLLIEQGAPPDTTLPHQEGSAVLHLAADAGDLELVKWLLARKADLKSLDVRRWTPLTRAAEAGQAEVAKFLLSQGARADDGSLFRAAASGHTALVELLLKHGADRDAVFDHHGYTALGDAAAEGKIEVVKLLHDKGASVKKDVGILHTAAFRGHREVVAFLLDKGADVEGAWPDAHDLYSDGLPRRRTSALA
ncbi:MAG TPA: ankyrin repeat domain-containing protein, partial [Gemmata sp.]